MSKTHVRQSLVGKKYGALTVLEQVDDNVAPNGARSVRYLCQCDCGNKTIAWAVYLKTGRKTSCGCQTKPSRKKYNQYFFDGDVAVVRLDNANVPMICDKDVWEKECDHYWYLSKAIGYACSYHDGNFATFHSRVIDCPKGMVRDHINQDKLDNRRQNLRIVTYSENNRNKKHVPGKYGIPGLYKAPKGNFYLKVFVEDHYETMGGFVTLEDAREAYEELHR